MTPMTAAVPDRRRLPAVVALCIVCGIALGGALAVPVAASDGPDDPASFYGSATDGNGSDIPAGATVVAVVDGETMDSIEIDPAGEYGGEGAFDGKLRVDSGAGDEVTFRLGDGRVGGTADLTPGVFEEDLVFPTADDSRAPDASADVDPSSASPDENVTFSASASTATEGATIDSYEWTVEHDGDGIDSFAGESVADP